MICLCPQLSVPIGCPVPVAWLNVLYSRYRAWSAEQSKHEPLFIISLPLQARACRLSGGLWPLPWYWWESKEWYLFVLDLFTFWLV